MIGEVAKALIGYGALGTVTLIAIAWCWKMYGDLIKMVEREASSKATMAAQLTDLSRAMGDLVKAVESHYQRRRL